MKSRRDFPTEEEYLEYMRNYIAIEAMSAIISRITDSDRKIIAESGSEQFNILLRSESYGIADTMLTEIKKK